MKKTTICLKDDLNTAEIQIIVHPNKNGIIVINYPGFNGDIDGYNGKYQTLAEFLSEKVGTIVRMSNCYYPEKDYSKSVQIDLIATIKHCIEESESLCGQTNPQIYLMGFSAGASAIAAVAYKFKEVKKILLISPSFNAGEREMRKGLGLYDGEVYICAGAEDEIVGPSTAPAVAKMVRNTKVHMKIIENCDHQFRGKRNGLIMSNTPIWAFIGGINFPTEKDGIVLYE